MGFCRIVEALSPPLSLSLFLSSGFCNFRLVFGCFPVRLSRLTMSIKVCVCVCICGLGNDEILCFLVYLDINKCSVKFDFLIFLLLMNTILIFYFKLWFNGWPRFYSSCLLAFGIFLDSLSLWIWYRMPLQLAWTVSNFFNHLYIYIYI